MYLTQEGMRGGGREGERERDGEVEEGEKEGGMQKALLDLFPTLWHERWVLPWREVREVAGWQSLSLTPEVRETLAGVGPVNVHLSLGKEFLCHCYQALPYFYPPLRKRGSTKLRDIW